jgi:hypothetical protein
MNYINNIKAIILLILNYFPVELFKPKNYIEEKIYIEEFIEKLLVIPAANNVWNLEFREALREIVNDYNFKITI